MRRRARTCVHTHQSTPPTTSHSPQVLGCRTLGLPLRTTKATVVSHTTLPFGKRERQAGSSSPAEAILSMSRGSASATRSAGRPSITARACDGGTFRRRAAFGGPYCTHVLVCLHACALGIQDEVGAQLRPEAGGGGRQRAPACARLHHPTSRVTAAHIRCVRVHALPRATPQ